MTSEKSYATEQRFNVLIAALGPLATFQPDASWTDSGSLTAGWGKGSGYFRWKLILPGVVGIAVKDLTVGTTTTDGTTILSAANGLTGYTGSTNKRLSAYVDIQRLDAVHTTNPNGVALSFITDGSVQCYGVAASATILSCYGLYFKDI
jgi:hypothetical protein